MKQFGEITITLFITFILFFTFSFCIILVVCGRLYWFVC